MRLTLFARQLGYLHAPIGDTEESRWEQYEGGGMEPPLPPVEAGEYLVEAFTASGMAEPGPAPLPWSEIAGFAQIEGLSTEEARALRSMSLAYIEGMKRGRNPLAIAPWEGG